MNIDYKTMIDLLIREADGAWWSEGCLFALNTEEHDVLMQYIKEYNKDFHLDLIGDREEIRKQNKSDTHRQK